MEGITAATRLQHGCNTAASRLQHGCIARGERGAVRDSCVGSELLLASRNAQNGSSAHLGPPIPGPGPDWSADDAARLPHGRVTAFRPAFIHQPPPRTPPAPSGVGRCGGAGAGGGGGGVVEGRLAPCRPRLRSTPPIQPTRRAAQPCREPPCACARAQGGSGGRAHEPVWGAVVVSRGAVGPARHGGLGGRSGWAGRGGEGGLGRGSPAGDACQVRGPMPPRP